MLKLPVGNKTFTKGFLEGKGSVQIGGDPGNAAAAFSPDAPFPASARSLFMTKVQGESPTLSFGAANGLACTVQFGAAAEAAIELVPASEVPARLSAVGRTRPVPAGHTGALLYLSGQGKVGAEANAPVWAGFAFGVGAKAGAGVTYMRYRLYDAERPARAVLTDLVSELRLPQARGSLEGLPSPDEVSVFAYSGFLDLSASLNWGYALKGSESFELRELEASVSYALRLKAALSLNYRLAGEFALVLEAGADPGWARLSIRKRRDARSQVAAGFQLDANYKLKGLPDTADDLLAAFLGVDAQSAFASFETAVALTDIDALEAHLGKLLTSSAQNLSRKWLGRALGRETMSQVLARLDEAVKAYRSLDDRLAERVLGLYADALGPGGADALRRALTAVRSLRSRDDLARVTDSGVWEVIQRLLGGDLFRLLGDGGRQGFADLLETAERTLAFLDGSWQPQLRDVVTELKEGFKLDRLFGELEKYTTKEKLLDLADPRIQGLVERIVGRSFEEIRKSDVPGVLRDLNTTLKGLDGFKKAFERTLRQSLEQSVSAKINYLYTRSTADDALVDMEFDLASPAGQALFQLAAAGRVREVLDRHDLSVMRVHSALLTHELTTASHLRINVLGWEHARLVEVVSKTEHSLEAHEGGLVQVFTTTAAIKQREESGRKHKEMLQTNFLLQMVGQSLRPPTGDGARQEFVIETLDRMSVTYDVLQADDMTDAGELGEYLALGQHLALVPRDEVSALAEQFPNGFGKVTAKYVVRFSHEAIRDAFTAFSGDELEAKVHETARRVVASHFVTRRQGEWLQTIGLAYLDRRVAEVFYRDGFTALRDATLKLTLPAWIAGGQARKVTMGRGDDRKRVLLTLFEVERALGRRVRRLDDVVDAARARSAPVPEDELEAAARDVVAQAGKVDKYGGPSTFFAIVDYLIARGGIGKAHRESALVLEINPPGGEKVTKYYMQASGGRG